MRPNKRGDSGERGGAGAGGDQRAEAGERYEQAPNAVETANVRLPCRSVLKNNDGSPRARRAYR